MRARVMDEFIAPSQQPGPTELEGHGICIGGHKVEDSRYAGVAHGGKYLQIGPQLPPQV